MKPDKSMQFSTRKAIAALLALLMLLSFASCGGDSKDGQNSDKNSGSGKNSDLTSTAASPDTPSEPSKPSDPSEEEDYPPMEVVYSYDGERDLQLIFLNNAGKDLQYTVIIEGKAGNGEWDVPGGVTELPSGSVQSGEIERVNLPLAAMPLEESPEFRVICRYKAEDWSKEREETITLHFGEKSHNGARRSYGSAADPAWSVDAKGRAMLNLVTEEPSSAWTGGTEGSELLLFNLSYADVAKLGDKAGVYEFYEQAPLSVAYGERTEEGTLLHLNTALGGKDFLKPGAQYDLCLTVHCLAEDGSTVEYLYLSTRVNYTAADEKILAGSAEFDEKQPDRNPIVLDKPVLYLYPEEETEVSVKLDLDGEMLVSWPAYRDGWAVTASPDGTLTDEDGSRYPYLFWEASQDLTPDFSKGFCVKGEETGEFLREILSQIGLTPEEYTDFIVYWLPRMQGNAYNVISFCGESYSSLAKLEITPAPDSILRVCMVYYGSDTPAALEPQQFDGFAREGFTVVEWGGSELKG